MAKTKLAVLVGGKSAEHEVSLISGSNVVKAVDKEKYEITIIGIDKAGRWFLIDDQAPFLAEKPPESIEYSSEKAIVFVPGKEGLIVGLNDKNINIKADVVFPVLHGTFAEDGTVQGLLELSNIPYVGAGVLGSAVGMDKDVMKRLMRDSGIPLAKFIVLSQEDGNNIDFAKIQTDLGMPIFVKPANLGSSVGVHKAKNREELKSSITDAFRYDNKIILEGEIKGREIECSVLGNNNPKASVVGEIITQNHDFYDYEAKYLDENGAQLKIPAELPAESAKKFQDLAVKTFKTLCCEGMGRVDGFLKDNGEVIINEINTIPGFTSVSMYPKLWEQSGLKYPDLIDNLIGLAIERHDKQNKLKRTFG